MYKIYHVPGIKIGCSTQPKIRVKQQGYSNFEVLEEHEDIYVATDRERELQKEYGYRVDECPYYKSYAIRRANWRREGSVRGGTISGQISVKSGNMLRAQKKSVEARKGTFHSEETKAKMRVAKLGKTVNNSRSFPFSAYDKKTLGFIGTYRTGKEAADKLNISQSNICSVLNGKLLSTGGYFFKRELI
jgi:hypothetical protein